jgi:hypothetical protein
MRTVPVISTFVMKYNTNAGSLHHQKHTSHAIYDMRKPTTENNRLHSHH